MTEADTVSVFLVARHDHDGKVNTHELKNKQKHSQRIRLGAASLHGLSVDKGAARAVLRTLKTERVEGKEDEDSAFEAYIDTREGCLRLDARSDDVYISPLYHLDPPGANDEEKKRQGSGWLHVQRSTTECKNIVYLRAGDNIRLGPTAPSLTVEISDTRRPSSTKNNKDNDAYHPPQNTVQVNSSQPDGNLPRPLRTGGSDHGQDQRKEKDMEEGTEQNESNFQEVAESMKGPDILVDRSTVFTESLLRSTSTPTPATATPRASIAQSEKIEDTPAVEGGRYYDASGMGALGTATTMTATIDADTADASIGTGTAAAEVEGDEEQKGEITVNGHDLREGTPAFYTPMPSMSTTTSPEGVTKGVQNSRKDLPMSPHFVKTKTYSQRGRKRSLVEVANDNRMADAEQHSSVVKAEHPSMMPKEEDKIDADQVPTISESPDAMAGSLVNDSRLKNAQQGEDEKVENGGGVRMKNAETIQPSDDEEKKQLTPVNKRKVSEKEAKSSRKRSKTTVDHEQQHNKENQLLPVKGEHVSPADKTHSTISPSTTREGRSSIAKTASPASKKYRPYNGPGFNIAFSNSTVISKPSLVRFLQARGCSVVDRVSDKGTDILCIGHGEVKKTSKLLLALAYDKKIVTDDWVTKSSRAGNLLDPSDFIPHYNPEPQSTSPSSPPSPFARIPVFTTSTTINNSRKNLLAGKSVYFTPALKRDYSKGFVDIQEIVMAVGAKGVVSMPARDITPGPHYIVLALESGDLDAPTLVEKGAVCYCKDLVTTSILRGKLELDSGEFRIVGLMKDGEKEDTAAKKVKNNRENVGKLKMKTKKRGGK